MRSLILLACLVAILHSAFTCFAGEFPYREQYPEINTIELSDLKSGYEREDFLIVDVRSQSEFEAIHIKKAVNLPYANAKFTDKLSEISKANPNKKIAVYCNGIDCIKSYKAAEDAMYAMIPHVYALDTGIGRWAEAYPEATMFKGKELKNPEKELIPEELFRKKNLDFATFKKMSAGDNAVVIDARDPIQRKNKIPGLEQAMQIPLDKLVQNIIDKGRMKDKQLYIFDQVGKQVTWLMYYLTDKQYTDFYFLEGGATAVLKNQEYRVATTN